MTDPVLTDPVEPLNRISHPFIPISKSRGAEGAGRSRPVTCLSGAQELRERDDFERAGGDESGQDMVRRRIT